MKLIDQAMFTLNALNLPDTLTPAEWTDIHKDILVCKRAASKHEVRRLSAGACRVLSSGCWW